MNAAKDSQHVTADGGFWRNATLQVRPVAVQSLGKLADLSPAALQSNSTLAMPLVNQLNSLSIPTEFATSQDC
jgi:hypothetical protein